MKWLEISIYLEMYFLHIVLVFGLLGSGKRLGRKPGDISYDKMYSIRRLIQSYGVLFYVQGWALWHLIKGGVYSLPLFLLGSLLFHFGVLLRLWSVKVLGDFFTMQIGIRSGHEIVEKGPYRLIRHPSYSGYLLVLAGMGIAYESWAAFWIPLVGGMLFFVIRVRAEEKMLVEHFGDNYRQYMKRTKRFIPYVF